MCGCYCAKWEHSGALRGTPTPCQIICTSLLSQTPLVVGRTPYPAGAHQACQGVNHFQRDILNCQRDYSRASACWGLGPRFLFGAASPPSKGSGHLWEQNYPPLAGDESLFPAVRSQGMRRGLGGGRSLGATDSPAHHLGPAPGGVCPLSLPALPGLHSHLFICQDPRALGASWSPPAPL